jgi:hypothetical protein
MGPEVCRACEAAASIHGGPSHGARSFGLCTDCYTDQARDRAAIGALPGTSWRFEFGTKRHAIVPLVTVEQLRAREPAGATIPRWTHAAPDGSRHSCGQAHKSIDAKCPAAGETWAVVPLNLDAHREDVREEGLHRFSWVLPLVNGLRAAVRGGRYWLTRPDEERGTRTLVWEPARLGWRGAQVDETVRVVRTVEQNTPRPPRQGRKQVRA